MIWTHPLGTIKHLFRSISSSMMYTNSAKYVSFSEWSERSPSSLQRGARRGCCWAAEARSCCGCGHKGKAHPISCHSADVMEDYIWIRHKAWLTLCDRKKACKYSVPTVSVQPSLGFNIQSIFNDPCGGCCWLKVRELSKTKWNNEAEGVQYNNSGMSELGKCVIKNEVGFILCTVLWY